MTRDHYFRVAASLLAFLLAGCTSRDATAPGNATGISVLRPPDGTNLQVVTLPDFSRIEEPIRRQLRERASALRLDIENPRTTTGDLGAAYGDMGQLLMAAQYLDAAEACYLNAQSLAPTDRRWPYYLGHLYRIKGPLAQSVTSFERALELQPSDVATLIWLGEVYLAQGRPEDAEPLFAKALALDPASISARSGAGRAALARRDYARAVTLLEEALTLRPQTSVLHYSLAMAYRSLGNLTKAEAHLQQQGAGEIRPADPLMDELDELLQSPMAYDLRGNRALQVGDWKAAAASFRKGLELAPADPGLRHRLGTALAQMGDARGAVEQFEHTLQIAPGYTKAHYSLGVLMEASGRQQEAVDHYSAALKSDPNYVQARARLAGILRRRGLAQEALAHYDQVLKADPRSEEAALGYVFILVGLQRYEEARDRLAAGMKTHPDEPIFAMALARLLAAAPVDRIRDGRRAAAIAEELLKHQQTIDLGETMAMALAELGQYDDAARLQRQLMEAATRAGRNDLAPRLAENLKLYELRKPSRTPWHDDEWDLNRGGI
jgi:tetratricopeptide (TPR) repeat protein